VATAMPSLCRPSPAASAAMDVPVRPLCQLALPCSLNVHAGWCCSVVLRHCHDRLAFFEVIGYASVVTSALGPPPSTPPSLMSLPALHAPRAFVFLLE
jgi:hypothetical protein